VGAIEVVSVGAMVRTIRRDFFAAFGVIVPVVETVLLVGVKMALLFFTTSANCQGPDQNQGDL
jgi:hypothetical protein